MYRVRAEAVSGTKVYAGGKWLTCIGNKPVSVGELIYTDGRCVYGNYQEAQQPLVIPPTAEEEIIPIVTTKGFYIFDKGKLKLFSDADFSADRFFIYNKKAKRYFVNPADFYPYSYLYGERQSHISGDFDSYTWPPDDSGKKSDIHSVIAANVDRSGNVLIIFIDGFNLSIKKNDTIIKTINFESCVDNLAQDTEFLSLPPLISPNPPKVMGDSYIKDIWVYIVGGFIENENNWYVSTVFYCRATSELVLEGFQSEETKPVPYGGPENVNILCRHYDFTNNGINSATSSKFFENIIQTDSIERYNETVVPDKTIPLQDGYYFKEKQITSTRDEIARVVQITEYIERTIYTPNGSPIFTGAFLSRNSYQRYKHPLFCKTKWGYLMVVYDSKINGESLEEKDGLPYFHAGIFLLTPNGEWKVLGANIGTCINQRLRPMKKIKNWYKRIQEIEVEELKTEEDEEEEDD